MAFGSEKTVDGFFLYLQQFRALFVKRILHSARNWLVLLVQLVLPVFMMIAAILINKMLPGPTIEPSLALTLNRFGNSYVGIYNNDTSNSSVTTDIYKRYEQNLQATQQNILPVASGNMTEYVLNQTSTYKTTFDMSHIIAAIFNTLTIAGQKIPQLTASFNNQPYHGPGITLNAMDNAILAQATNGSFQITTNNHPLPPNNNDRLEDWLATGVVEFNLAIFLMFGMAFLASSFVVLLIRERISKAKHLQLLGGLPSFIFWLASFTWDFLVKSNFRRLRYFVIIIIVVFTVSELPDHCRINSSSILCFQH